MNPHSTGRPNRITGQAIDITDQKSQSEEITRLRREAAALSANVTSNKELREATGPLQPHSFPIAGLE